MKWISVEDRLPEVTKYYLCIQTKHNLPYVAIFDNIEKQWRLNWEIVYPKHWMPLPEPPKEGE